MLSNCTLIYPKSFLWLLRIFRIQAFFILTFANPQSFSCIQSRKSNIPCIHNTESAEILSMKIPRLIAFYRIALSLRKDMSNFFSISFVASYFYPAICNVRVDNFSVSASLNRKNINSSITDDIMVKIERNKTKLEKKLQTFLHLRKYDTRDLYARQVIFRDGIPDRILIVRYREYSDYFEIAYYKNDGGMPNCKYYDCIECSTNPEEAKERIRDEIWRTI